MVIVLEAVLSFLLFTIIGNLPLAIRRMLGRGIGTLISLIPIRESRIAKLQLKLCNLHSHPRATLQNVYQSVCVSFFESLNLSPLIQSQGVVTCPQIDSIKTFIEDGRGVVALTAHTGNWDLQGAYFIAQGMPVYTIGREARSKVAHTILRRMRERYGIHTIWRSDTKALKEIMRVLQHGNVLASLIDQDTVVSSTLMPFFGIPAKTPSSLVALAKKWNCHIVTSFIVRSDDGRYTIHTEPVPKELSENEILMLYHERLEQIVKTYPEQWVWFHKRWRSATEVTLGTTAYINYLENVLHETT